MVLKNQAPEAKMIQSKFPLDNFCMSVCVCVCIKKQLNKNFIEYTIILPCKHDRITTFFWEGRWIEKYMVTCNYSLLKFDFVAGKKKNTAHFFGVSMNSKIQV